MSPLQLPLLVEPDELERHLGRDDILVVDLSERSVHLQHHVPGAVHLEYARIVAGTPPAPGALPDEAGLAEALSSTGLRPGTHVVAYDDAGNGKACRLLWTLDVVGHPTFSLLDGGLHAWLAEGHPTEAGLEPRRGSDYTVVRRGEPVAARDHVLAHLGDPGVVILDARTPAEYASGHIPGAVNVDWTDAIDRGRNLRLKPQAELRALFEGRGVTRDKEVIAHCQTHVRSAHTYIVLKLLGYPRIKGYPGAWAEWASDPDLPVETGPHDEG